MREPGFWAGEAPLSATAPVVGSLEPTSTADAQSCEQWDAYKLKMTGYPSAGRHDRPCVL
jgi:hypothetical protein